MNDNKRIAVNTGVLYIKLILSTLVGLFISRQVLLALGTDDYGLFSVVGGLVAMINILGATMISTSYRYIAVEIGKGATGNPHKTYNTLLVVHIILAILVFLVGETLGVFYISHYLNVEISKIPDALFVLHCSLIATSISVVAVPSQGLIVAREKFIYTALLEIADLFVKLLGVIWLIQYPGNRLRGYSIVVTIYTLFLALGYMVYCWQNDRHLIRWQFNKMWGDYRDIFSFSFYMLIGAVACIGRIQGVAVIINWFYGTTLNAAFGLASQVNNYTTMFVKNLTQATNPQIMKNYGANNRERSMHLVYVISKISFMVMLVPVVPLIFYMDDVLTFWLKEPPSYTGIFSALLLVNGLVGCVSSGFDASIQATGKVRKNQIGYSVINLLLLPIVWVMYSFGMPPYSNVIAMICLTVITVVFQCWIMRGITSFRFCDYFVYTLRPSFFVLCLSLVPLYCLRQVIGSGLLWCIGFILLSTLWIGVGILLVGLTKGERVKITQFVMNKIVERNR